MARTPDESGGKVFRFRRGQWNADRPHHSENGFAVKWAERIGPADCPMMVRWVLETPLGSLRLHHFIRPDRDDALHDHPWWFVTLPLSRGGYAEQVMCQVCEGNGWIGWEGQPLDSQSRLRCQRCGGIGRVWRHVSAWRLHFRPSSYAHAVKPPDGGCWTLILTGRKLRRWGFWQTARAIVSSAGIKPLGKWFFESREYFGVFGFPPCVEEVGGLEEFAGDITPESLEEERSAFEATTWMAWDPDGEMERARLDLLRRGLH